MDLLGIRTLPFFSRRNFYYEIKHLVAWSVLAGLVEGQFAGIVVAKTFEGSARMIAIASATPSAAYLFSLFWGMLCVGRPKIPLLVMLSAGVVLLAGLIGAIPATHAGAVWFLCQMAAAQVLLSGVVTMRSALWKSNYPRSARARITARLQTVRFMISITTVLVAAWACDAEATAYHGIFPIAALLGAVGLFALSRIRIRGERGALRRRSKPRPEADPRVGLIEPFTLTALLSPPRIFGRMVSVLRNDRRFARYCLAQAFSGVANFMTIPVVVAVVTQELDLGSAWGFWVSTALIQALPQLVRLGSIGRWARLFDRVGVLHFRVVNVLYWSVSLVLGLGATLVAVRAERIGSSHLTLAVALFALRGISNGLGLGGGALAWNIGHLHFAQAHEAEVYMGIHVFLTGVRGLTAPLLGMWLFQTIGWPVWMIAIALSLCSFALYAVMARGERDKSRLLARRAGSKTLLSGHAGGPGGEQPRSLN